MKKYRTGIGQDSHRFLPEESTKPCILAGLIFEGFPGLASDSDGDVIFHAICNAITSVSGVQVLGAIADDLCQKDGITDSQVYLEKALDTLGRQKIEHIALAIEAKRPRLKDQLEEIRAKIAKILQLSTDQVGVTATAGEGLTECGLGEGVHCICIITTSEEIS